MNYFGLSPLPPQEATKVREDWLQRLTQLIDQVEAWSQELGWATRRIERKLEDPEIGDHRVPALLMQEGVTRVILEPIGRSAPGVDGVVDLYRLPAYDDITTIFHHEGQWLVRYPLPADPIATRDEVVELKVLTFELVGTVLADLVSDDS